MNSSFFSYRIFDKKGKSIEAFSKSELWYKAAYKNPYPNKTIETITPAEGVVIKEV